MVSVIVTGPSVAQVEILVEATKKFDSVPPAEVVTAVNTVTEETYARPSARLPVGALHLRI